LNHVLSERGEPDIDALETGLDILSNTDLRSVHRNAMPAMIVMGERDTLVPIQVTAEFEKMFDDKDEILEDLKEQLAEEEKRA